MFFERITLKLRAKSSYHILLVAVLHRYILSDPDLGGQLNTDSILIQDASQKGAKNNFTSSVCF